MLLWAVAHVPLRQGRGRGGRLRGALEPLQTHAGVAHQRLRYHRVPRRTAPQQGAVCSPGLRHTTRAHRAALHSGVEPRTTKAAHHCAGWESQL